MGVVRRVSGSVSYRQHRGRTTQVAAAKITQLALDRCLARGSTEGGTDPTAERSAQELERLGHGQETKLRDLLGLRLDLSELCLIEHTAVRSEERRVGKECRSRWSPYH